jgi:hypothetical protein
MVATSSASIRAPISGLSRLVEVENAPAAGAAADAERAKSFCAVLETGNIIYLPRSPILLNAADRELLLGHKQTGSALHKNIAYRPLEDRISGLDKTEATAAVELRRILQEYAQNCAEFLSRFLAPYAGKWKLDFASFRPIEEEGRAARLHARNDLLHFDSFPTRPTDGARILRFFTNINPKEDRVWLTSETFASFAPRVANMAGIITPPVHDGGIAKALRALASFRWPWTRRPAYDRYMNRCHNVMKESSKFQAEMVKQQWSFPPNSSWMVFTDGVSHAVIRGQYALEQTFLIPQAALIQPQNSPLAILEKLTGRKLAERPGV